MRYAALTLVLLTGFLGARWSSASRGSFETEVKPILERKCVPCHFAGGKMYDRLPFDRSETIVKLGERLFTRIKDEQERATIRKFLAEQRTPRPPA